jgi:Pyruvate/2-oxoacid:ferredoxin oxidoreductase gamma subunit
VGIDAVESAVRQRLPGRVGEANAMAAAETYELVRAGLRTAGESRAPTG